MINENNIKCQNLCGNQGLILINGMLYCGKCYLDIVQNPQKEFMKGVIKG